MQGRKVMTELKNEPKMFNVFSQESLMNSYLYKKFGMKMVLENIHTEPSP